MSCTYEIKSETFGWKTVSQNIDQVLTEVLSEGLSPRKIQRDFDVELEAINRR